MRLRFSFSFTNDDPNDGPSDDPSDDLSGGPNDGLSVLSMRYHVEPIQHQCAVQHERLSGQDDGHANGDRASDPNDGQQCGDDAVVGSEQLRS